MFFLSSYIAPFIGTVFFLSNGGLSYYQLASSLETPTLVLHGKSVPFHHHTRGPVTFSTPPQEVSIADLLRNNQDYHQQIVSVRGLITQPELHLDETELYLDFVFRLSQGTQSLVVYGRHDRTQGAPPIIINRSVDVIGIFRKEQDRKGLAIFNALEAISVTPYPSSIPGST